MPTYDGLRSEYISMFDSATLTDTAATALVTSAVCKNSNRYKAVGDPLGIPWYFIGVIHALESGCNFKTHLHNGDSLNTRTVHVPTGRPKTGNPPFTWEFSATDAMEYEHFTQQPHWELPWMLFRLEAYNGWGYRNLKSVKCPTPYLWSKTNHYTKGKFVEELRDGKYRGVFKPEVVSKQVGAAALLKFMEDQKLITITR